MRHGQTLFNYQHKIQGWCDSPLTELGKKQAETAGAYFKKHQISFDHAYSSTSERACDTLEIVTAYSMPYIRLKGLKEYNFGSFEGKDEFLNPKFPFKNFFEFYGGETDTAAENRITNTLMDIMQKENHKRVLAVSHGGVCGLFTLHWFHTSKISPITNIENCSILIYEFENDTFTLTEYITHDFSKIEKFYQSRVG